MSHIADLVRTEKFHVGSRPFGRSKLLKSIDSGKGNLLILLPGALIFLRPALIRLPLAFATLPARARVDETSERY